MSSNLTAITPIDGRYHSKVKDLHQYFSEAALMRYRILIEIEWFIFLFNELSLPETRVLEPDELRLLRGIYETFDVEDAQKVKDIEKTTNHDVKAIEYFIKDQLRNGGDSAKKLEQDLEFIHFGCTSADINNLSYSCMVRDFLERDLDATLSGLIRDLHNLAVETKEAAMMGRTHGQPATPTTMGKEMINFVSRLEREFAILKTIKLQGKINGAVGNFNAHMACYPDVDWMQASKDFVESLGLDPNLYTAQIEQHDCLADVFDAVKRINTILIDYARDMWGYISFGYFKQKVVKGEVGSSTMPHKVNPIDFENGEGNLGLSVAVLEHLARKLPISRFQRDLTDSTVLRNVGVGFAYAILGYKSIIRGISKCLINEARVAEDLNSTWELLAEPIQMVMRKNRIEGAYEQLKELTRGKDGMNEKVVRKFIEGLKIDKEDKERLMKMTPASYIGAAIKLVEAYDFDADEAGGCGPSGCGSCNGCG
jgi:adenylosuccinate lyase